MESIIVVGAGTMGAGIAFVAAGAGYSVELIEPIQEARARAEQRIRKDAQRANDDSAAARIRYGAELGHVENAVLGIEAVPEQLGLKRAVFARLEAVLPDDALIATNTSSLSVSEIAEGLQRPERALGLHFFNPPALMRLVEIVRAQFTGDRSVERAMQLVRRFGKTPVIAKDTPGFIVNRVARPFYLQAMRAYEAGVAPMETLDALARGAGFRMGPFELMDLIGLNVNLATSQSVYERSGAARLKPVALQEQLVAQGRLGRKSGAGFYDYGSAHSRAKDEPAQPADEAVDTDERIAILGGGGLGEELFAMLQTRHAGVRMVEGDLAEELPLDTTIAFDVGDGASDRTAAIETLDASLPPQAAIFVDAYATDIGKLGERLQHPQRVIGYGVLCDLAGQKTVEIVDSEATGDDMLELAQELFHSIGRSVALVDDRAGLFLGRTVGSIVNEAVSVVEEGTASADDVDAAMRLGVNYPRGPIEWGRRIGGDRISRILQRLARAEGAAFAPHRALWVLDVQDEPQAQPGAELPS